MFELSVMHCSISIRKLSGLLVLLIAAVLTACGGGGGDGGGGGGISYVVWSNSANGSTIKDAANQNFAVDSSSRTVVYLASTTYLTGLTVDTSGNVLNNGTIIGYVGLATSTSNTQIALFYCSNASPMTISLTSSWSTSCSGTPGGGGTGPSANFTTNETSEINATLTSSAPNYVDSSSLTLATTTRVWSFSWAQYSASFWALDANNAALFRAGQAFYGYPLIAAGSSGMSFVNLPAGTWYVGVRPNQTIFSGYTNQIYAELSVPTLSGATEISDVSMHAGGNPGAWQSQGFTVTQGYRTFLETEGSGGTFAVMTPSQLSSFQSAYSGGYNGGAYSYTYACGQASGGAALEIECEMLLPAGSYYLVYMNSTAGSAGGAANIGYFQ